MKRSLTALGFVVCSAGCAVQLDGVYEHALAAPRDSGGTRLEGRVVAGSPRAFTAGASLALGPREGARPFGVQSVQATFGVLSRPLAPVFKALRFSRGFGWELVGDVAYGGPLDQTSAGSGFYLGVRGALFARVCCAPPRRRTVRIVWFAIDLAFSGSLGVWTPPSRGAEVIEPQGYATLSVGVRAAVLSDVILDTVPEDTP